MDQEVEFDTDEKGSYTHRQAVVEEMHSDETSGMTGWLIKHRLATSPKVAQVVLVAVVAVNIIIMLLVIRYLV